MYSYSAVFTLLPSSRWPSRKKCRRTAWDGSATVAGTKKTGKVTLPDAGTKPEVAMICVGTFSGVLVVDS